MTERAISTLGIRRARIVPSSADALRIAMLAPPWIAVPPPAYGGIEHAVALLCEGLVQRGHEVTLFAAPGSRSVAKIRMPLDAPHPEHIGQTIYEVDHVARAFSEIDAAAADACPFDVVHDHCGFAALAMAERLATPMVHTLHGAFTQDTFAFYAKHGLKARIVAISQTQIAAAPVGLQAAPVIPNPIAVERWPFRRVKDDYLLWIGRMAPEKGPHRAIEAARLAGQELIIAGPIQPGQESFFTAEVEPHIDGSSVRYVGEVGGRAREELFSRARALLMPIRWPEPFGMVMIEALATGTPVIAFPEGAASEIVLSGENGLLANDEAAMASAVHKLTEIDPQRCRASVKRRYDVATVAKAYEDTYRAVIARADQSWTSGRIGVAARLTAGASSSQGLALGDLETNRDGGGRDRGVHVTGDTSTTALVPDAAAPGPPLPTAGSSRITTRRRDAGRTEQGPDAAQWA